MIRVECRLRFADRRVHPMAEALAAHHDRFREYGIDWDCPPGQADLVWANQQQVGQQIDRPTILHEVRDAAAINWSARQAIGSPQVLSVVKSSAYRPRELANAPHFENSYHGGLIYESAPPAERPAETPQPLEPRIAPADLKKVRLGYNWLFVRHLDSLAAQPESRIKADRDIDVFFAGSMIYERWHIGWHRRLAAETIAALPGRVLVGRGRVYPQREYHDLLDRSRIVVSPWGFGETCIRDLEALLAGCILIKPHTGFIDTWPDYHAAQNCLFCRPDFTDLPEVTAQALDRWLTLQMTGAATAGELKQLRTPCNLVQRIAEIIQTAIAPSEPS